MKGLWILIFSFLSPSLAVSQEILVAAASDLIYAFREIQATFEGAHPGVRIKTSFGSSGNFHTQIRNGAPYQIFFSADTVFPEELKKLGMVHGDVVPYGRGRIVLWWPGKRKELLTLQNLAAPDFTRIALANPRHAPYGQRGKEALQTLGLWSAVEPRVVLGDNIAQTAQFVLTGNAQVGILALSLALSDAMRDQGEYYLVPEDLHTPLDQGFVVLVQGKDNPVVLEFAFYFQGENARKILNSYGFILPRNEES